MLLFLTRNNFNESHHAYQSAFEQYNEWAVKDAKVFERVRAFETDDNRNSPNAILRNRQT
jgi:hypothetical protein